MTDKQLMQMALDWANKHGEVVFAGGGWDSVNSMNEWTSEVYARLSQCERCGEVNPAEIHTCTPKQAYPDNFIDALRYHTAINEQPEPEGNYSDIISDGGLDPRNEFDTAPPQRQQRTYTLRKWQGLTGEEILEEYRQSYGDDGDLTDVYFARAIEAKLKEKNSA